MTDGMGAPSPPQEPDGHSVTGICAVAFAIPVHLGTTGRLALGLPRRQPRSPPGSELSAGRPDRRRGPRFWRRWPRLRRRRGVDLLSWTSTARQRSDDLVFGPHAPIKSRPPRCPAAVQTGLHACFQDQQTEAVPRLPRSRGRQMLANNWPRVVEDETGAGLD